MGKRQWLAVLLSLVGIWCMSWGDHHSSPPGIILALISAVLFAGYILMIDVSALRELSSLIIIFYVCCFTALVYLPLLLLTGQWPMTFNPQAWIYCGLVAVFCTAVAMILFVSGIKLIGPTKAAILSTLEPVVSIMAGVIILGEDLTRLLVVGCGLVLVAVLIISWRQSPSVAASATQAEDGIDLHDTALQAQQRSQSSLGK